MKDKIKEEVKSTIKEFLFVCLCGLVPLAYIVVVAFIMAIKRELI